MTNTASRQQTMASPAVQTTYAEPKTTSLLDSIVETTSLLDSIVEEQVESRTETRTETRVTVETTKKTTRYVRVRRCTICGKGHDHDDANFIWDLYPVTE